MARRRSAWSRRSSSSEMTSRRRSPRRRSLSLRRGGRSRRSTLWCSRATMPVSFWPVHGRWGASPPLHNRPYRVELRGGGRSSSRKSARGPRAACDARAPSRPRADSEPMTTQRKNRRKKAERRTGGQRRTGLERRLELETAGDQIQAALGLLTFAVEQGVFLDEDRWLLETAITRLRLAVEQLGEGTDDSP